MVNKLALVVGLILLPLALGFFVLSVQDALTKEDPIRAAMDYAQCEEGQSLVIEEGLRAHCIDLAAWETNLVLQARETAAELLFPMWQLKVERELYPLWVCNEDEFINRGNHFPVPGSVEGEGVYVQEYLCKEKQAQ